LDQEYRNHNRRPCDRFCGLPGYSCESSFAIRNGAYSLSGRYFLAFATVASGMLQYYFAQAARIREAGRVKCSYVEQLVSLTFFHEPMTDRDRSAFKRKIAADMRDIESEHGAIVDMQAN
jgi:hypothetical protein